MPAEVEVEGRERRQGRDVREAVVGDVAAAEAEGLEGRHARKGPEAAALDPPAVREHEGRQARQGRQLLQGVVR